MHIKKGIPVSPGIVVGEAFILENEDYTVIKTSVLKADVPKELERLEKACADSIAELNHTVDDVSRKLGKSYGLVFDAYVQIISDPDVKAQIRAKISSENHSAEHAVETVLRRYIKTLSALDDPTFSSRAQDIIDIRKRLLRHLSGDKQQELSNFKKPHIIVAKDLTPSQTASLDRGKVLGFVTDAGGRTSHTAIVARALNIPAVVGLETITLNVSQGDTIIVDGNNGTVIINPNEDTLKKYRQMEKLFAAFEQNLVEELRDLPAETTDDHRIQLMANIEFPEEIPYALKHGAEGVGLYRTEFLYISRKTLPLEEDHFRAYKKAITEIGARPIVIRTLDLGSDKIEPEAENKERNPFLGCRAIRLCMQKPEIFKPQLKAIMRAAHNFDNVKMMLPMVTAIEEVRQIKNLIEQTKLELIKNKTPFNDRIPLGIMIETPAAATIADILAKEVEFFSIGTNDLIQYSLAVDRINEKVAYLYQPAHPAILRIIKHVIDTGSKHKRSVAMCGEMSGDPLYTLMLLGLGLKEFSVSAKSIPVIKKIIRSVSMREAKEIASKAMELHTAHEVKAYLVKLTKKIVPETF